MGLDMYLKKKIYIGANYEHNQVTGVIDLKRGSNQEPIKIDLSKVTYIEESAGYWRKANAIHAWIVKNVQDGEDNCAEYYFSPEKMEELKTLCEHVVETKRPDLLPPQEGFFFGSTEIDEYYYGELFVTIDILNAALKDKDGAFYYRASW